MARRAVDVGGYAIVLPRGPQAKVADLALKYGFRSVARDIKAGKCIAKSR